MNLRAQPARHRPAQTFGRLGVVAAALSLAIACAAGCGGSADSAADGGLTFAAAPIQKVQSDSGALLVAVHPQAGHTPARGANALRYVITDSSGAPVEGVQVTIAPWMPDMGHGSSVTPTVTAAGGGAYDITNVYFPMPGRWDLVSKFTGPVSDAAKPSFQIP